MKLRLSKPPVAAGISVILVLALAAALFAAWPRKIVHDNALTQSVSMIEPAPLDVKPAAPPVYEALSRRLVEYHISVSLVPEKKELHGAESVTWENPGSKPVQELYLHLYPNAFESDNSTFNRESGGKLREDKRTGNSVGGMKLTTIQTEKGDDLSRLTEFVRPDDGNLEDHTLLKVRLLEPVAPGGKVTLRMEFRVQLPEVFARMGYSGDFYMAGQWFPKVAVYEPAGTRGRTEEGWNLHQYHGNSEFYADFGIYDVKIRVPSGYTVAATGFPTKPATEDKTSKTYRFYADDVHDFAWAASPRFVYQEEKFSAPGVPGVKIKLYLDPLHKPLKNRYFQAAKKALTRYSEWYGEYPYSTLSIVVPPAGGNGAGGMEYPTLITAWGASSETPDLSLERVIVHEIGHQWWYGMVASNEFEEAWLDEAFTSYAEDKVMEREYGELPNHPVEAAYITGPEPLQQLSWKYGSHDHYADNVYLRGKLVLNAIERQTGADKMNKVLRAYFDRYKFRHPSTENFQAVVERVTGRSWADFFDAYVYGNLMSDFSVDSIRVQKAEGSTKEMPAYESQILIRKLGGPWPTVPVRIHFADGSTKDIAWSTEASEIQYKLVHSAPVDWVQIDPERTLVLESRVINNHLKAQVDDKQQLRFSLSLQKIIEALMIGVAW
ncbi:M1 family metallopeptidase [Gorillibacterium sp. CAU 1737]|uniref:M1 family metallopeptidase n=1 Tax=Gorillibacterium sp. CAU 1737 TaxID=3140362 RepID=UPI0032613CFD